MTSIEASTPSGGSRSGSKVTYPALDGLRALAITLVFIDHFGGGSHGGPLLVWFNRLRVFGASGVSLFFVLSGFLITGILFDTRNDEHYFKNFYIRRSLRIFPIFYLVLAVCAVLTPLLHLRLQWGHLSFLFYMGNLFANWNWGLYELISPTHPLLSINLAHFWSLFVEEQFYLLWPVAVLLIRDRRRLIIFSLTVIVLVLLLRIGMVGLLPFHVAEQFAFRMLPTRADDLLIGGTLALLIRGPEGKRWLERSALFFFVGILTFFGMACWRGDFGFSDPYNLTIGLTLVSLASAGMIGLAIQTKTVAFRIFSTSPLRKIGKYSYGFYVYHVLLSKAPIAYLLWCMTFFRSMALGGLIYSSTSYLAVLGISAISYNFYEKRFLAIKSQFQYASRTNVSEADDRSIHSISN